MGVLLSYKCAKCKSVLPVSHYANQPIGQPFLICPSCQTINIVAKERNEWALMKPYQRLFFRGLNVFQSLFIGVGSGFLITVLVKNFVNIEVSQYFTIPIGVVIWYIVFNRDISREINESNKRMSQPEYLALIRRLGLDSKQ